MTIVHVYIVGLILSLAFYTVAWLREDDPDRRTPIPGILAASIFWPAIVILAAFAWIDGAF